MSVSAIIREFGRDAGHAVASRQVNLGWLLQNGKSNTYKLTRLRTDIVQWSGLWAYISLHIFKCNVNKRLGCRQLGFMGEGLSISWRRVRLLTPCVAGRIRRSQLKDTRWPLQPYSLVPTALHHSESTRSSLLYTLTPRFLTTIHTHWLKRTPYFCFT